MPNFKTGLTTRQEQFSIAWLYAITSAAGYSLQEIRWDNDSVDAQIHQKGDRNNFPEIDQINVQLKCSYAIAPIDGQFRFRVSRKNYDDLRSRRSNPRILILLHVPRGIGQWLEHTDDSMLLRNCAYWTSLTGLPAVQTRTVTVYIPIAQKLTITELSKMMRFAAAGRRPEEMTA
jgi:hypothetical protein